MKMKTHTVALVLQVLVSAFVNADLTVTVNSTTCEEEYDLDLEGTITLQYFGAYLWNTDMSVCKIAFISNDLHNDLCIDPIMFENDCLVSVEYHGGHFHSNDPDASYCHTRPRKEWCIGFSKIYVAFEKTRNRRTLGEVDIQLQISTKSTKSPDFNPTVTSLSVLIAVVVVAAVITMGLLTLAAVITYKQVIAKRNVQTTGGRAAALAGTTFYTNGLTVNEKQMETENWMNLHAFKREKTGTDNPAYEDANQKQDV